MDDPYPATGSALLGPFAQGVQPGLLALGGGRLGPVEVSELTGRQETIEFRLPPELTEGRSAERATAKV